MFFEQYSHEPYIAVARMISRFLPADHPRRAELPGLLERGNRALAIMEQQLSGSAYFAGERCSVADIALYAYTHCAGDGGFELDAFPAVKAWIGRLETEHAFRPIR
jgi:glutathione S-transferase